MRSPAVVISLSLVSLIAVSCGRSEARREVPDAATSSAAASTTTGTKAPTATLPLPPAPSPSPRREHLTLIAGGDVFFGRIVGQVLLAKPHTDVFSQVRGWLRSADMRFANLESQLSEQKGVTVHPDNRLVFTGPPIAADALARAGFDIVSLANNHMWDFGKDALWQTFANLERVKVAYVGAGRNRETAYGPVVIEREGFKLAFVAVTDIWNMGQLSRHVAREFVHRADPEIVRKVVEKLRRDETIDAIVVSYHGGSEYMEEPTLPTRKVVHAAIDAGADIVLGHHPHVAQGISWYRGRPIVYSLGNFTMGMKGEHPWSQYGFLARVRFTRDNVPAVAVCPFLIDYFTPVPLSQPRLEASQTYFFRKLRSLSRRVAGSTIAAPATDGCASVTPPARPYPGAIP